MVKKDIKPPCITHGLSILLDSSKNPSSLMPYGIGTMMHNRKTTIACKRQDPQDHGRYKAAANDIAHELESLDASSPEYHVGSYYP